MSIEIKNINKNFKNKSGVTPVLKNISLDVKSGELLALLGPSGSGKTTLLRVISGLEDADSGRIMFHGEDATKSSVQERRVGFVFQHYALFRHMTIYDNVAFGLTVKPRSIRPSKKNITAKVIELLRLVQLDKYSDRYPSQLSGGQRQRVALARALAVEPQILLLDEPFGALDARVRRELRQWLRRLHDEIKVTSVFVTHDQDEALEVADRVVIMNDGEIEQIGTPYEVYENPANEFVYDFVGNVNKINGVVRGADFVTRDGKIVIKDLSPQVFWMLRLNYLTNIGKIPIKELSHVDIQGHRVVAYIKPHDVELFREESGKSKVEAEVTDSRIKGAYNHVEVKLINSEQFIQASVPVIQEKPAWKKGDRAFISLYNARVFLSQDSGVMN